MMDDVRAGCLDELKPFLAQPGEIAAVSQGKPIFESSAIDSVTLVGIVVALEDRFSIEFDADNIEEIFHDLSSLSQYVSDKLAARPG